MNGVRGLVLSLFLSAPCWGQKYVDIRVRPERTARQEAESMANITWLGGTVWNTTTAWSTGTIPTTDDLASFKDSNHDSVLTGHTDGVAGPAQILVHPGYLGDIGSPGAAYYKTGLATITWRGPGKGYFAPDSGDSTDFIIDNDNAVIQIDTQCRHVLIKAAASVDILPTCTFTGELQCFSPSAIVTIHDLASAENSPVNIDMRDGTLYNKRTTTTAAENVLSVAAAVVYQTGLLQSETNVRLKGGLLHYAPAVSPASDQPDLYLSGGVFDARDSDYAIPVGTFIVAEPAEVYGSIVEGVGSWADYDLRQDWPSPN